jgi:hypothetical protein
MPAAYQNLALTMLEGSNEIENFWKGARAHGIVPPRREGGRMSQVHNQVVVHFDDGRLLKGYTHDFFPEKATFHVSQSSAGAAGAVQEIRVADCKAIFFVRSPAGDVQYAEKKRFEEVSAKGHSGIRIKVEFRDGEIIRGISMGYNKTRKGFFIVPVDPMSNNERIYVVAANVARTVVGAEAET